MNEETKLSVGQTLAAARLAQQRSIEEVASKLKLTPRQIEAIEADEFHDQAAPVFVRGFVRNYARLLGIDAQPLLALLDMDAKPTENLTAHSEGVRVGASSARRWLLIPLGLGAVFLLLVALLYVWLSGGEGDLSSPEVAGEPELTQQGTPLAPPIAPAIAPIASPVASPATSSIAPATSPNGVAPAPALPVEAPAASSPVATPPGPPAAVTPAPASVPAPLPVTPPRVSPAASTALPAPAAAVSGGPGALVFSVSEDAWIQVVDAAGRRFSKYLHAGASDSLRGKPPFRLVIGNAAQVKVTYNDQLVDLKPHIGNKVARLTLE